MPRQREVGGWCLTITFYFCLAFGFSKVGYKADFVLKYWIIRARLLEKFQILELINCVSIFWIHEFSPDGTGFVQFFFLLRHVLVTNGMEAAQSKESASSQRQFSTNDKRYKNRFHPVNNPISAGYPPNIRCPKSKLSGQEVLSKYIFSQTNSGSTPFDFLWCVPPTIITFWRHP